MTVSDRVTHLSPGVLAQMPSSSGDSVRLTVCVTVSDCISLPTHVCLGPKGHLAPFQGWVDWQHWRLLWGGAGRAGSEVKRAESPSFPTQPHQADRQMEKMFTPGAGRRVAAPPRTALCTENKFFWYQLEFGRKWLLGGRKLDSAHISPGRGAGEQLSGVKQSYREAGAPTPCTR